LVALTLTWTMALPGGLGAQQAAPAAQSEQKDDAPRFQETTGVTLVSVDVNVRDSAGNPVKDLKPKDFIVKEDGKVQRIDTFSFQELGTGDASVTDLHVLNGVEDKLREDVKRSAAASAAATATAATAPVEDANATQNRRMIVLLFDVSSMQPEDTQRAIDGAQKWVDVEMEDSDLVSLVSIGNRLTVLNDFTSSKEDLTAGLQTLGGTNGTFVNPDAIATALTDDGSAAAADDASASADDTFGDFNNDVRLRAIKTVCETIAPIQQRKAMMYFSAGMSRSANDNEIELNNATNTCRRGNVLIFPVDTRGLQAMVAGGSATSRSSGGAGLFNGSSALRGLSQITGSQGTLSTLAADTGGKSFTDSNDFGEAFDKVQKELGAYYLLGYSSTNDAKDGKFRKITVTINRPDLKGLKVENRQGYYAGRSFRNTNGRDREAQLTDEMAAAISSTDIPMVVGTGFFRQQNNKFYVPIAVAIPGFAVPVGTNAQKVSVDIRGEVRDEQQRVVGTLGKVTMNMDVPAGSPDTLAGKQVFYESGAELPPGQFTVKVVARENTGGAIGSFEAPIIVPQLKDDVMKVSSVVMSTQLTKPSNPKAENPLVRDGQQLLPNLTRTVARNQKMYFYYEVYDPSLAEQMPLLRTSLRFFRAGVQVFETPVVERTTIDEPGRKAVVFQFEVPAEQFKAGNYTCLVNIIDQVAGKASWPRLSFTVIN
jgi:VWFA-related protein